MKGLQAIDYDESIDGFSNRFSRLLLYLQKLKSVKNCFGGQKCFREGYLPLVIGNMVAYKKPDDHNNLNCAFINPDSI